MNKTENRKDEFDLALENMKLEPEADLDRLIEKRVKQMMTRISLQVVCGTAGARAGLSRGESAGQSLQCQSRAGE